MLSAADKVERCRSETTAGVYGGFHRDQDVLPSKVARAKLPGAFDRQLCGALDAATY